MKRKISRWILLCMGVVMLGGCGRDGGGSGSGTPGSRADLESGVESGTESGSGTAPVQEAQTEKEGNSQKDVQSGGQEGSSKSGNAADTNTNQPDLENGDSVGGAMLEAYVSVLEDIYRDHIFPGGKDLGYQPGENQDVTSNEFSICDVDGDGKEELIIVWTTTFEAAMAEIIYGYDDAAGTVTEEFSGYPLFTIFNNGIIQELASHNHGMASNLSLEDGFWPYTLYRYNLERGIYEELASVDAWSKAYMETDYDGNAFPEDIDKDGDGLVYYINAAGSQGETAPVDAAEYQAWLDSCTGSAKEMTISFQKLTEENIQNIK
ncbi:MAG: hypothetical protein K2O06_07410 [Acetatifactor sp.]|nr:hypothetical protein [Acetatifactor sp.]